MGTLDYTARKNATSAKAEEEQVVELADFGSNAELNQQIGSSSSGESMLDGMLRVAIARDESGSSEESEGRLDLLLDLSGGELQSELGTLDLESLLDHLPEERMDEIAELSERCTDPAQRLILWQEGFLHETAVRTEGLDNGHAILMSDEAEVERQVAQTLAQMGPEVDSMGMVEDLIALREQELAIEVGHEVSLVPFLSEVSDTNVEAQMAADRGWDEDRLEQIEATLARIDAEHLDGLESIRLLTSEAWMESRGSDSAPIGSYRRAFNGNPAFITLIDEHIGGYSGSRGVGETSTLGDHLSVGDDDLSDFIGEGPVSQLEKTLAHEIGHHVERNSGAEVYEALIDAGGWENLNPVELRESLREAGLDEEVGEGFIERFEEGRDEPYNRR
ncbi:MAG: hypothetical protein HN348_33945, partial [Proteobacteria bacterium]|nr:hypothetical protein [Pseudomonadota bacterium]